MLFPKFIDGAVYMHNGQVNGLPLNYDMTNQAIQYMDQGQVLSVANADEVDSVVINGAVFIPLQQKIYHLLTRDKLPLLVTYKAKVKHMVTSANKAETGKQNQDMVSNTVSDAYVTKRYQQNREFDFGRNYWIKNGQVVSRFYNEKQLARLFPKRASSILQFCRNNKTDFDNQDDVMAAVAFANESN